MRRARSRAMDRRIGVAANWPSFWVSARIWFTASAGSRNQPHRLERYMASNDPDFETKAADIIGLYLHPPQHAAVFCVDEKSAIQALDRLDPVLPLSPGRAERHGFEYFRHGTPLPVCRSRREDRQGSWQDCRAPHRRGVCRLPRRSGRPLCPGSRDPCHCRQSLSPQNGPGSHFPGGASARSTALHTHLFVLAEPSGIWFVRIEREVIARGVFTSVKDLSRKLMRYIRAYSKTARPFRWKYANLKHRITYATVSQSLRQATRLAEPHRPCLYTSRWTSPSKQPSCVI